MRWDFVLFFASVVMIYLGDWALYIGVVGLVLSVLHGVLKTIKNRKAQKMVLAVGLIVSGTAFIGLCAFALKPSLFGLPQSPTRSPEDAGRIPPAHIPTAEEIANRVVAQLSSSDDPTYLGGIVGGMTNNELANITHKFSNSMRDAEAASKLKGAIAMDEMTRCTFALPQNDPRRNACWNEYNRQTVVLYSKSEQEFRRKFLPSAQAIRNELQRRTGSTLQSPDDGNSALDNGSLAGVSPMSDAADFLDALARELPQASKKK